MQDFLVDFGDWRKKMEFLDYLGTLKTTRVIFMELPRIVRELNKNEYYFGVVLPYISQYSGHTVEELHQIYVETLLPTITFRNYYDLTTTDLTDYEINRFIYRVKFEFQRVTGIYIPDGEKKQVLRPHFQSWPEDVSENFQKKR